MHMTPLGLILILGIVVILFGGGRIGKLGGELGTAIKEFKRGLNDGGEEDKTKNPEPPSTPIQS